jgi:ATP-binding protein involved in chromosome partitioning
MSMGFITGDNIPVIWRGPLVTKMIQQFLHNVAWGDLDYLVLDLPPGTGDVQITVRQSVSITGAVIVTTPQNLALEDVKRGILMFRQVDVPIFGVIENMSAFICPRCKTRTDIFGHGGGLRLCEQMGVSFLGEVPLDPQIRKAGDEGVPIVVGQPDSPQADAFRKVAAALVSQINVLDAKRAEQAKLTEGLKVL